MEAARISETLVQLYQTTRCYYPEDSHLHTHRRENIKSYLDIWNSHGGDVSVDILGCDAVWAAEDGGSILLWNVGICLQVHTASHPEDQHRGMSWLLEQLVTPQKDSAPSQPINTLYQPAEIHHSLKSPHNIWRILTHFLHFSFVIIALIWHLVICSTYRLPIYLSTLANDP
jgi:hypothetical protein